ncbi:unnamed protein product [Urochloa humidicola]
MEDERNTQYHHGSEAAADQVEVKDRSILDTILGRKKQPEAADDQANKQEEDLAAGMDKVTVADHPAPPPAAQNKEEAGDKKESLLAKLHRSGSSSSSSSDEEEEVIDDNGEIIKRKKKKGLKEKIKEKLPGGGHKQDHHDAQQGDRPTLAHVETPHPAYYKQEQEQEGDHKAPPYVPASVETHAYKEDEHKPYVPTPAPPAAVETHVHHHDHATVVQKVEDDAPPPPAPEEEKKGLLDKIKEKLPGGHKKPEDAAAAPAGVHAPAPAPHVEDVSSPDGKEKKGLLGKIMDKIPGYNKASADDDHKDAGDHKTTSS